MNAKLSKFIGCRPANTTCSPCNKCCRQISSHFASSFNLKPNIYIPRLGQKTGRRTRPFLLLTPCACRFPPYSLRLVPCSEGRWLRPSLSACPLFLWTLHRCLLN